MPTARKLWKELYAIRVDINKKICLRRERKYSLMENITIWYHLDRTFDVTKINANEHLKYVNKTLVWDSKT